jgi:heme-degrading monooxygenase HmoA
MIHVLGEVSIGSLSQFLAVFSTRGAQARGKHGCTGSQVFAVQGDEHRVVVLLEWPSKAEFEAFLGDPEVKASMQASGTSGPPKFTILERVGQFPS